jgi:hypothetical protein
MESLQEQLGSETPAPSLRRRILEMVFKFAGQPLTEQVTDTIMREIGS